MHAHDSITTEDAAQQLMSLAVEGRLSDAQWAQLEALAKAQPALWRELCLSHRDDLALRAGVAAASTNLPALAFEDEPVREPTHTLFSARRAWMGWAAAAMLGLVALVQFTSRGGPTPIFDHAPTATQNNQAGIGSSLTGALANLSSDDLLNQYVQTGREEGTVFGVLPERVVLQSTPMTDGAGYEVVYLRQIVERVQVPDFYSVSYDEQGNAYPVRVTPRATPTTPSTPTPPRSSPKHSGI
jgi:hypothetical protein